MEQSSCKIEAWHGGATNSAKWIIVVSSFLISTKASWIFLPRMRDCPPGLFTVVLLFQYLAGGHFFPCPIFLAEDKHPAKGRRLEYHAAIGIH